MLRQDKLYNQVPGLLRMTMMKFIIIFTVICIMGVPASHVDQDLANQKVPDADLSNEDATDAIDDYLDNQEATDADRRKKDRGKPVYYTKYGKECKGKCKGTSYSWCYPKNGSGWDYCSINVDFTYQNKKCWDQCAKRGYSYYWCSEVLVKTWGKKNWRSVRKMKGAWSYCSPVKYVK